MKYRKGNLAIAFTAAVLVFVTLFAAFFLASSYRSRRYALQVQMAFFSARYSTGDIFVKIDGQYYEMDDEALDLVPQYLTSAPTLAVAVRNDRLESYEFILGSDLLTLYLDAKNNDRAAVYFECGDTVYRMHLNLNTLQQRLDIILDERHLLTTEKTELMNSAKQ